MERAGTRATTEVRRAERAALREAVQPRATMDAMLTDAWKWVDGRIVAHFVAAAGAQAAAAPAAQTRMHHLERLGFTHRTCTTDQRELEACRPDATTEGGRTCLGSAASSLSACPDPQSDAVMDAQRDQITAVAARQAPVLQPAAAPPPPLNRCVPPAAPCRRAAPPRPTLLVGDLQACHAAFGRLQQRVLALSLQQQAAVGGTAAAGSGAPRCMHGWASPGLPWDVSMPEHSTTALANPTPTSALLQSTRGATWCRCAARCERRSPRCASCLTSRARCASCGWDSLGQQN